MRQARSALVPFTLVAVFLSSVSVTMAEVEVSEAQPNWKNEAGKCVLAPGLCGNLFSSSVTNCRKAEKKFLKPVQDNQRVLLHRAPFERPRFTLGGRFGDRCPQVSHFEGTGSIENHAEGALRIVLSQKDDRAGEIRIRQRR